MPAEAEPAMFGPEKRRGVEIFWICEHLGPENFKPGDDFVPDLQIGARKEPSKTSETVD